MSEIVSILAQAFEKNRSVSFVVKQDSKKDQRIKLLMVYSLFRAYHFGKVFMNADKTACALVVDSSKKRLTFQSLIWDLKLIIQCVGLFNLPRVLKREKILKTFHPKGKFYHLWYVGVKPENQRKGLGTNVLRQILQDCNDAPIYLETSSEENFPFFEKFGFVKVIDLKQDQNILRMYKLEKS